MNVSHKRNVYITLFVILWSILFHYESLRALYLEPAFHAEFPKFKFLFPPAGWIMFYNVDDQYSTVEVYGLKAKQWHPIDPHDIFRTRTIGFDNIHRNILSVVAVPGMEKSFCRFLQYRFPHFDNFAVALVYYPSLTARPPERWTKVQYQCVEGEAHE